jgi:ABC-type sugar transport system permease subunit
MHDREFARERVVADLERLPQQLVGILVGLAMHELPRVRVTINPVVQAFRFIVPFAWISLVVLWFGTSLWGKVFLVTYAVFFVMVISTLGALRLVDPTLSRVATVLGMSRTKRAFVVHLRAAAPSIASAPTGRMNSHVEPASGSSVTNSRRAANAKNSTASRSVRRRDAQIALRYVRR